METTTVENQSPNSQDQNQTNSGCLANMSNLVKVKGFEAGDYGQVTIYQDPIHSQLIAVKTLSDAELINGDNKNSFKCYKELNHKCIAPVIGFNLSPLQVATPYSRNGSLNDLLFERQIGKKNILSNANAVAKLIVGIVRGMSYLHMNDYHYVLKPSNVLIDEDGNPSIVDYFNHNYAVSFTNQITSNSDAKIYLPLEIIEKNVRIDTSYILKAIDSYSFAIILYEILFNKPVFPKNISSEVLIEQLTTYRPDIPDTVHPVVKQIIERCWSNSSDRRLSFYEIFLKLQQIDFKITPNVEPEIVKSYIDSLSKQIEVNIRLWNGNLMPILVSYDDRLFEIRQKIAEKAKIDFIDVILSRNNKPLTCCWVCNQKNDFNFEKLLKSFEDRNAFLDFPVFELAVRIFAVAEEYPKFEGGGNVRSFNDPTQKPGEKNETSFFMAPGTIQDLIDNMVYQRRHLWMLKNYKLKIRFNNHDCCPNESMFDDGITNNARVIVDVNWNTWVEINNSVVRCNLDDPVDELICRYVMMKKVKIDGIPCLSNYTVNVDLNSSSTIRNCGIVEMDKLEFNCIQTDNYVSIKYNRVCYDPNHSIRTLKLMWILATKQWIPISKLRAHYFFFDEKDYDKSIDQFFSNGYQCEFREMNLMPEFFGNLQY